MQALSIPSPRISPVLVLLLALMQAGAAHGQSGPEACLQQSSPEACLNGFDDSADGLGEAWRSLGLRLVEEGQIRRAAEVLSRATEWEEGLESLAMWAAHFGNPAVLQPARAARNRRRALAMLRRDSTDVGANLFLGTQDAREVTRRSKRTTGPRGVSADQLVSMTRSTRSSVGAGARLGWMWQEMDMTVTSPPRESRLIRNTVSRLEMALESTLTAPYALRQLAIVRLATEDYASLSADAARIRALLPNRPDGYLIGALAAQREGRTAAAATLADMALDLVGPAVYARILDPTGVLPPGHPMPADITAWWREQDPVVLTEVNERLAEHVARWVYADVRFGNPYTGDFGTDTDPGRVILRYGIPNAEVQLTGGDTAGGEQAGLDRFAVFQYPAFDFRFMDFGRRGEWSFYAPRATAYQGWRANSEVRANDHVILARQRFRDIPTFIEPTWETGPLNAAVFRQGSGFVVLATGVVPADLESADTGAMAIDTGRRIVSLGPADVAGWTPGRTFFKELRVPSSRSASFEARVEAVAPASLDRTERTLVLSSGPSPAPTHSGLAVSGIVLASLIQEADGGRAPGAWTRGGLEITPSGDHRFAMDAPLYVYFEAYGLTLGQAGATSYELVANLTPADGRQGTVLSRLFRRGSESVGAGFEGSGASPDISEYLLIDSRDRSTGEYLITLTLHDRVAGTTVETTTRVHFH